MEEPRSIGVDYVFAGLAVRDRDSAMRWYEQLFGTAPQMIPNDLEAVWRVSETASVYVVVDAKRAGGGIVTLVVEDLESTLAGLRSRRIAPPAIETVGTAGRKATVVDPDGNTVAIVQLGTS